MANPRLRLAREQAGIPGHLRQERGHGIPCGKVAGQLPSTWPVSPPTRTHPRTRTERGNVSLRSGHAESARS